MGRVRAWRAKASMYLHFSNYAAFPPRARAGVAVGIMFAFV